ncbi:MAG: hypothetical protein PHS96_04390 [Anaerolineales bacterium]|nr:hypothetical protein [Anaerolineales bacterium]
MSTQVRVMANPGNARLYRLVDSLPGRAALAALTVLAAAGAVPLVFLSNRLIPPLALKLITVAALGLVSGFAARSLLVHSSAWWQRGAALLALAGGLLLLSPLTNGYAGIALGAQASGLAVWDVPLQGGVALLAAWLSLHAWKPVKATRKAPALKVSKRSQAPSHPPRRQPAPRKPKIRPAPRPAQSKSKTSPALPLFVQSRYWRQQWSKLDGSVNRLKPKVNLALTKPARWANDLIQSTRLRIRSRQRRSTEGPPFSNPGASAYPLRRSRRHVRLKAVEEHRCPFCLEAVKKNDPRGVKICPICNTYHHADCWAVTGTCQVPHQHE